MSDIGKRLSDILNLFSKCIGVIADFLHSLTQCTTSGMSTQRTEQGCRSPWLWTPCRTVLCQSWPPWEEGEEERLPTEAVLSPPRVSKEWKCQSHWTGDFTVRISSQTWNKHRKFRPPGCSSDVSFSFKVLWHQWRIKPYAVPAGVLPPLEQ